MEQVGLPSRRLQPWCWRVSDKSLPSLSEQGIADPTTELFWQSCIEHRLLIQRCSSCGKHQFYPRPFCLSCEATTLEWVESAGTGTIYSVTTVRIPVVDDLKPPYFLALVDLDEGPRLLTNIDSESARIGDRVTLAWRSRDGLPPLPIFRTSPR
jgi:uncharacterized OB-fold protein